MKKNPHLYNPHHHRHGHHMHPVPPHFHHGQAKIEYEFEKLADIFGEDTASYIPQLMVTAPIEQKLIFSLLLDMPFSFEGFEVAINDMNLGGFSNPMVTDRVVTELSARLSINEGKIKYLLYDLPFEIVAIIIVAMSFNKPIHE